MLTDELAHCSYINTFPRAGADDRNVDRVEQRADPVAIADNRESPRMPGSIPSTVS